VTKFYNERRKQLLDVKPNRGHELLAEMEKYFRVTVITQNVDNLHERAGSSEVIHLHGELTKVTSTWQPNNPNYIRELTPEEYEVKIGDLASDGSQLRPYIVWFGESVPMIETAIGFCEKADIFLIIGTSLNVYPAAGLLNYVPAHVPVYLIDPNDVPIASGRKVHVIQKGASEGMKELMHLLIDEQ
jgi:NAD-dependent deacetylase